MASLLSVSGTSTRQINILLINPNSTQSMTDACLRSVQKTLPPHVHVYGFTGPVTGPMAVEGKVDGVLSAADCFRALYPLLHGADDQDTATVRFDAFLVACFSAHPLIEILREEYTQPCVGIMEAALHAARMCGHRVGVITTSERSSLGHGHAMAAEYGFTPDISAGGETGHISVLELESRPRVEVYAGIQAAARRLVEEKGADCICMGCAGMTEMREACLEAVGGWVGTTAEQGRKAMVIDGVAMGVHFLAALVAENLETAKGGLYRSAAAGRARRGQTHI